MSRLSSTLRRAASIALISLIPACGSSSGGGTVPPPADGGQKDTGQEDAGHPHRDGGNKVDSGHDAGGGQDSPYGPCEAASGLPAPRLVAPMSTAIVTSQKPTLHWELPAGADGAEVDVCSDRACSKVITSFSAPGSSGAPPAALSAGVYFWRARATSHGAACESIGAATSFVWQFWVGAKSAPTDASWGHTTDVNGDGYADVVLGAAYTPMDVGNVHVYMGGPKGLPATPITIASPGAPYDLFGFSVDSAGDVDGDGFGDVVVTAAAGGPKGQGFLYLFRGGPMGLATTPTYLLGPGPINYGYVVRGAGDINGDGYADVFVGTDATGGGVYVYFGGPAGLGVTPITLTDALSTTSSFGISLAAAGDVNADGFADILVAAPGTSTSPGAAYLYMGSSSGLNPMPARLSGAAPGDGFGAGVACAGDVNGDGFADIAIGASGVHSNDGAVYLYLGSAEGVALTPLTLTGPPVGLSFGVVAGAGDLNGDGYADLLVGSFFGGGNVFLGGSKGLSTTAIPLPAPYGVGDFGTATAGLGDVNGDGFTEIGLLGYEGSPGTGAISVFSGGKSFPSGSPVVLETAGDGALVAMATSVR